MPQYVQHGPDVVEFPDNMPDAQIAQVLRGQTSPAAAAPPATPPQKSMLSRAYSAVAEPVTRSVEKALPYAQAATLTGGFPSESMAGVNKEAAKAIVPQTPLQAGIMAGTMGVGPAVSAGSKAGVPMFGALARNPAIARILGATVGGGAGGAAEQGAPGVLTGAAKGALAGTVGEGLGKFGTGLARATGAGKNIMERADIKSVGQALHEASPALPTARNAQELLNLAGGGGQKALSAEQETGLNALEKLTGLPLSAVKNERTKAGRLMRFNPEQAVKHEALTKELDDALAAAGPEPAALAKELASNYRAGNVLVGRKSPGSPAGVMRDASMYPQSPSGTGFDISKLQAKAQTPEWRDRLTQKLGPEGYQKFLNEITGGAGQGKDTLGALYDKDFILAHPVLARILRVAAPNLGASYVGKRALQVPTSTQAIMDTILGRATE